MIGDAVMLGVLVLKTVMDGVRRLEGASLCPVGVSSSVRLSSGNGGEQIFFYFQ